jgi:hypothetical protein
MRDDADFKDGRAMTACAGEAKVVCPGSDWHGARMADLGGVLDVA